MLATHFTPAPTTLPIIAFYQAATTPAAAVNLVATKWLMWLFVVAEGTGATNRCGRGGAGENQTFQLTNGEFQSPRLKVRKRIHHQDRGR